MSALLILNLRVMLLKYLKQVYTQDCPPEIIDIPNLSYTLGDMYTRNDVLMLISNVRSTSVRSLSFSVQDNFNIKYYRLGVLNLPQGGNHAWIKVVLTNGYTIADFYNRARPPQNYVLDIYIYSSNGGSGLGSYGVQPSGGGSDLCYHYGQVFCSTWYVAPLAVVLKPVTGDTYNMCEVWVQSHTKHGKPLITATVGAGGNFITSTTGTTVDTLSGIVKLPISAYLTNNLPAYITSGL